MKSVFTRARRTLLMGALLVLSVPQASRGQGADPAQVNSAPVLAPQAQRPLPTAPTQPLPPAPPPDSSAASSAASANQAPLPAAFKSIDWQPATVAQGSVLLITVELAHPATRVSGSLIKNHLNFFRSSKPNVWYTLAGADMDAAPGLNELTVEATQRGRRVHARREVDLASGNFGEGSVTVPNNFVQPDEAAKRQIERDNILKKRAYDHLIPIPQWSGDFIKPVNAPSTPSFGETRLLNEEETSQHRGTDFPAKEGAPVSAANNGTVVLAAEMFYEGNCVILDHGDHFFTVYMHLSQINVKVGQRLGLTGATGRVTGPHLHVSVRWRDAYLNPLALLAMNLPETHPVAVGHPASRRSVRHRR